MIIEELNLDSDEETLVNVSNLDDESLPDEYDGDVFYSYPYYSNDNFDYQFRLILSSETIKLEDIKSNETDLNSTDSIKVLREYPELTFDKGFQMIQNIQDIRTGEVITLENDTINYSFTRENAEVELEKNKKIVLAELYKTITE
jgi:hypothetical protein